MDPLQPRTVDLSKGLGAPGTPSTPLSSTTTATKSTNNNSSQPIGVITPPPPDNGSGFKLRLPKINPKIGAVLLIFLVVVTALTVYVGTTQKTKLKPKAEQGEHNECNNNTCETVPGSGPNQCSNPGGCCGGGCGNETACESDSDCGDNGFCNKSSGRCQTRTAPPPTEAPPKTCSYTTPQDRGCDCDKNNNSACFAVHWYASCDNGIERVYNQADASCNSSCSGCTLATTCPNGLPPGSFIKTLGCVCDTTNFQCVMKNQGNDGSCKVNDYTTYDPTCAGKCGSACTIKARTATQVCGEKGGIASGSCTGGGTSCRLGSPTNPYLECCYGDANATARDGSCYKGNTGQIACGGSIKNVGTSAVTISVNHYTAEPGDRACPLSQLVSTGQSVTLQPGQEISPENCEQIDAVGYCGACNASGCGADKTPSPTPTPVTHKACQNLACAIVTGAGRDTCASAADCSHKACVGTACSTIAGAGVNSCATNANCVHKACQNQSCTTVTGAGVDSCTSNSDCTNPSHKACVGNACSTVPGGGTDTCTNNSECTHNECVNNACTSVDGQSNDQCSTNNDCSHKLCLNQACVTVVGAGQNLCSVDSDCSNATHKVCSNSACTTINGGGANLCNLDSDCTSKSHKECRNNACIAIAGTGTNQCTSDASCQPAAVAPPIPQSGSSLPTILTVGTGTILTILGLLLFL